jgi:uncharacterized protein (DUF1800 family)
LAIQTLSSGAIALNRFGLGARPGDAVPTDPQRWLVDQFDRFDVRPAAFAALDDAGVVVQRYREAQQARRRQARADAAVAAAPAAKVARADFRQDVQALYRAGVQARVDSALATSAPFVERMVHFWSNHFCVSVDNAPVAAFAGAFERDAIRPHVLGRFADMLLAVEQHPAMLIYLNQAQSIGPNSPAAARAPDRRRGLNENLAREIMELHTLGVRSGYGQADVTEFARALTGWTVDGLGPGGATAGSADRFAFRAARHEPGARVILGRRYAQPGEAQARAVLLDFARAPATAQHLATKLARHFAGDDPPPAMVARLAASFAAGNGDLPTVYRALIASPEAWGPAPTKFKTPWEWTVSSLRGLGRTGAGELPIAAMQAQLGQRVWKPGSPAGWDDVAASWAGPDALLRRVEIAQRLAAQLGDTLDARTLAPAILPAALSLATAEQIAHSESRASALALMLVSPEFLRR